MSAARAAYIVDAARTPYGRRGGALSSWHPVDLAAEVASRLVAGLGLEPGSLGAVVLGCVSQVGAQAYNIARRSVLAAGWPDQVPGWTIEGHAASSALAVQWAADAVLSGAHALVVAGGIEVMTAVPLGASIAHPSVGKPLGKRLAERFPGGEGLPPPGLAAEEVARRWSLPRGDLDEWALGSFRKALAWSRARPGLLVLGHPPGSTDKAARRHLLERDENIAPVPTRAQLRALVPAYLPGGVVTAGNMAREGDGASAVVVASDKAVGRLALGPKARFVSCATAAGSPGVWPVATVPAARCALKNARLRPDAIDWWYVYESSAAAVLALAADLGADLERVNPDGGALATTSPLGAVGAGLFATAVERLASGTGRRALVCVAGEGGVASACVLESVR
jgi:acetyl-CoA acyltransferase